MEVAMIEDIQLFEAIYQDEDTSLETVETVALDLSEIDAIGLHTGTCWANQQAKSNLITKSANTFVLLEPFENLMCLWKAYKQQEKKTSRAYLYN